MAHRFTVIYRWVGRVAPIRAAAKRHGGVVCLIRTTTVRRAPWRKLGPGRFGPPAADRLPEVQEWAWVTVSATREQHEAIAADLPDVLGVSTWCNGPRQRYRNMASDFSTTYARTAQKEASREAQEAKDAAHRERFQPPERRLRPKERRAARRNQGSGSLDDQTGRMACAGANQQRMERP